MSDAPPLTASTQPPPTDPPPPNRRRNVLIGLVFLAVVALVAVLLSVVSKGDGDQPAGKAAATGAASPSSTNDPVPPQAHTTLPPIPRSDTEAAVRNNWPMVMDDEFDGSSLDTSHWQPYSGETTGGVGQHSPKNISVADGVMTIDSHAYSSGGMAWMPGQMYGRWEVRARSQAGSGYGPVLLLWPDAEDWPKGGEIDFMEIPKGDRQETNFTVHYGKNNSQNGIAVQGDFTGWHNYAVEWTPDHISGYIDGQEIFRTTDPAQLPPRKMHLAIQQDIGPYGNDWIPALSSATPANVKLQVDWVRIYGL